MMLGLSSSSTAALLLAALSVMPAAGEELPFVGRWDCGVAEFTFTQTTYNNGGEDLSIQEIQEGTDGSYTLFFDDDYLITLSGFTGDGMGWYSHASGDNFDCRHLTDTE